MANDTTIQALRARRQEIAAEIGRLQKEDGELEIAERVFDRFAGKINDIKAPAVPPGPPRPEGTPTLYEMVLAVITAAPRGLTGAEIVSAIGERFWPGVRGPQILPPIYQFAKQGRLFKTAEGKFFKPGQSTIPPAVIQQLSMIEK